MSIGLCLSPVLLPVLLFSGLNGGDANLFGYVMNDPINYIDLTGEFGYGLINHIAHISHMPFVLGSQAMPFIGAFSLGYGVGTAINYACNNCAGKLGFWIYDLLHPKTCGG